jgi:hypothetical protein
VITLRDGTVIDESVNAVHLTAAADVPSVFRQGPRVVTSITIHWWGRGADGQPLTRDTYDMNMNYLASDNDRSSSAHYIAKAKRVNCLVSPDDAAWHAGSAIGNTTSVGIECCPEGSGGDYETVAALVAFIRSIYGDIPLVVHNHWVGTECPGVWDIARLDALARNSTNTTTGDADNMAISDEQMYELKTWVQGCANTNGDRVINDNRAQLNAAKQEILVAIKAISTVNGSGTSLDLAAIAKAVADEEAKRLAN